MSTHCHIFSPGVLYGTRGTPIGIIVATLFTLRETHRLFQNVFREGFRARVIRTHRSSVHFVVRFVQARVGVDAVVRRILPSLARRRRRRRRRIATATRPRKRRRPSSSWERKRGTRRTRSTTSVRGRRASSLSLRNNRRPRRRRHSRFVNARTVVVVE